MLVFPVFAEQDTEDYDDFDALFDDITEDIVVEEAPLPTIVKDEPSSIMKLSGSFSSKLGAAYIYDDSSDESKHTVGGVLDLSNTLNLSVDPSDKFGMYGSVKTDFSGKFSLSVSSLYFNTLMFDAVYLSAGKKSISWGNLRLFTNTVLSDSGNGVTCEIRYPWKLGTISGVILYDYNKYNPASLEGFSWKNMSFAGACDITLLNTNINAFVRKYPVSEKPTYALLVGLEMKRTILGFDAYIQGTALRKREASNITGTGGFYRLWDEITPNIGINIEYQCVYKVHPRDDEKQYNHFINAEFGIRKIGPSKNMKGAIKWNHDIVKKNGTVEAAFIISSLIPYADLTNGIKITYGSGRKHPKIEFGTALSFSLSY